MWDYWWCGCVSRTGALFFVVVNQCFSSLSAAELFIAERKIFMWVSHSRNFFNSLWGERFSLYEGKIHSFIHVEEFASLLSLKMCSGSEIVGTCLSSRDPSRYSLQEMHIFTLLSVLVRSICSPLIAFFFHKMYYFRFSQKKEKS